MQTLIIVFLATACIAILHAAPEQPAAPAAPDWVRSLFPPAQARTSLRLLQAEAIQDGVEVICQFRYPDIKGRTATGKLKLFLPATLAAGDAPRIPLMHFAGYELDRPGAAGFLARGIATSTPHAEEFNPLVRGENVDVAILHRVRALPFVDDAAVEVFGGSAGGYMTLLLAAETFPLNCCAPDVPPLNLGYNVGYLARNKDIAHAQPVGQDQANMPVVTVVTLLADQAQDIYGPDFDADAYLAASPLTRLDCITCPTLITAATADLLVPMNQFGAELVKPLDRSLFPEGFTIALDEILTRKTSRRTLLDLLGQDQLARLTVRVPADAPPMRWDGTAEPGPAPSLPASFSRDHQFSLVIYDEAAPEPQCGHTKHAIGINKDEFLNHFRRVPPGPGQLTVPKLTRLMQRCLGLETFPALVQPPGSPALFIANRLDFPEAERADVLRGLKTFAADPDCAARLKHLYSQLPDALKALGTLPDFQATGD